MYKQTLENLDTYFNYSDSILNYHHKKQRYNSKNNQCNYDNIPNLIYTNINISIIHFNICKTLYLQLLFITKITIIYIPY